VLQRNKRWLMGIAVAAALAAGCMPPTRVEFIEKLAMENRKIARSTRAFKTALEPLATGQNADSGAVHSAYDDMVKTVKEVKRDMAGQMLPPSSPHAKDFLDAYKDYLDAEQAILDGPMQQIVAKVDDNSVEPAVKWDTIKSLMAQVKAQEDDRDNGAFPRLMTAQATYAHDHNYQPFGLADYVTNQKNGK
jgi:hypothetical protein